MAYAGGGGGGVYSPPSPTALNPEQAVVDKELRTEQILTQQHHKTELLTLVVEQVVGEILQVDIVVVLEW